MKVVVVEPGKKPEEREIKNELKPLQEIVAGPIETTCGFMVNTIILCNEEGKIRGLPYNRALLDKDGVLYDVLVGNFICVGVDGEEFCSLTDAQAAHYVWLFSQMSATNELR